jgi:hypothetical protein
METLFSATATSPDLTGRRLLRRRTGQLLWKRTFNDFLSDTIYLRWPSSSPAVVETGNVYMQGTGVPRAFTAEGDPCGTTPDGGSDA